jgi:hypothetical protein
MNLRAFLKNPIVRVLKTGLLIVVLLALTAWVSAALSVHFSGKMLMVLWGGVGAVALAVLIGTFKSARLGWVLLLLGALPAAIWYQTIKPAHGKQWAVDVAHGVEARVEGDMVSLANVRNFAWQSETKADASWEAREYDLSQLASVDMLTSVWDSPDIAHLLVSFGFSDGQRVVFSVETRREAHEEFNEIGGFFRQFELVLIAATEEDIVKLRTNYRQEDVRLYPLKLDEEQRRNLFMSYVALANTLEEEPAFYNTVTRNCTTTVYPLAKEIKPDMNLDWRILASGHLPSYIDQLGGFDGTLSLEARSQRAAITPRALAATNEEYSDAIRTAYQSN